MREQNKTARKRSTRGKAATLRAVSGNLQAIEAAKSNSTVIELPQVSALGRLPVMRTLKMFIGGKFPRSESERYYSLRNEETAFVANVCRASRKDFREAIVAARNAALPWSHRAPFNRGQILYRIAELMESRSSQFKEDLVACGRDSKEAVKEVAAATDRLVYYAGWADKYQQVFGSINPVSSSHFNFSVLEPMGIIAATCPDSPSLLGLVSVVAPLLAGGNCVVVLASYSSPLVAVSFSEICSSSDVPGGVVNILTGLSSELTPQFASHMDVNAVWLTEAGLEVRKASQIEATKNLKRLKAEARDPSSWWDTELCESPYCITDFEEVKTTWHPIGQ